MKRENKDSIFEAMTFIANVVKEYEEAESSMQGAYYKLREGDIETATYYVGHAINMSEDNATKIMQALHAIDEILTGETTED